MSEADGKKLFNKVLVAVIASVILQLIIGGFFTWKMSYKNTLVNDWQENSIIHNSVGIDENRKDIRDATAQFYILNSNIKDLKAEITKK